MYRTSRIETRIQMYSCKQVKQVLYINMYLYKRENKYNKIYICIPEGKQIHNIYICTRGKTNTKYIYLYQRENKYIIYIFVQEEKQVQNIYIYI